MLTATASAVTSERYLSLDDAIVVVSLHCSGNESLIYWSWYRPMTFTRMFEPRHNIFSNVRTTVRKYVVSWFEHSRESNRPVPGPLLAELSILITIRNRRDFLFTIIHEKTRSSELGSTGEYGEVHGYESSGSHSMMACYY